MADARDGPSVAARLKLCAQATGEAVAPQDEAMIRILSQLAVERNWWSFSVNPTPMGKQFIVQPQSQWERDRERQQAKEGSTPPQPVPAATSAAAPPAAPPAAAAAPAAAPQAHPQHQQVQQPQPNESPEGWTRVGKGGMPDRFTMRNPGRKPPGKAVKRKPDRQPAPKGGGPPPPSPKVNKNRLSALGAGPSGTSGSHERAPPRSPSPSSPPAKSPRPSVPASEYDSEFDFSDAEAQDRTAGVVHDAVQQAVMQYGYDDELFQAWRDGEIRRKDLPEEVVAMAFDLCERWRAEQERCRRVHAAQRLSRDPGPSHSRSRSRSPNSCRSSVSGCDEG
ncbi:hypothetical protein EMIHUDRAFT_103379 [Emiliania huxleyi CCMP1516]|uniref:WW domain-containing protein n=2 Tax=Emiliania huxleyi TaxID=2903 RepID=A0A0D3IVZ2_EMIH1|nr:hypothetical protein EMIHUDRAFT_103379 [Emiliania huxleyi CCMP1516]EOD15427.1 hypothetical protein EMIHUDRAFT_103379 [Emiliania huxleyi CCMP1516]|eukprot:XP_005767856.1 hypothetical protein EMIHUDRAFT_103379 [Emiliania huxleyi CCMP1516]